MSEIEYEVRDRIAYITLNRPERSNAINAPMRKMLMEAFTDVRDNDAIWLALLTGKGKAFCAGRDLIEKREQGDHPPGPQSWDIYTLQSQTYKPMVCGVNGACVAQGCGLALSCDIVIAAESARFGWPQVKRGIASVSGPTLLARQIPLRVALQYMFTGELMSAQEALSLHLINQVVSDDEVLATAEKVARNLLQNAPLAVRAVKEATLRTRHMRADEAYTLAKFITESCDATEDAREGLAAFAGKRVPAWKAR